MLAEVFARLQTVTGAGSVHRLAFAKIPEGDLPALVQVDGAEVRPTPGQQSDAGTPDFDMRFGVLILVEGQDDASVPALLTSWRAKVIDALARDRTSGEPELGFGGLLQWVTCTGADAPAPASEAEAALPRASQLLHFAAARPEAEMNPWLQAGF